MELGELILRDGSDLEDNFSDSSVEEDLSDESDSLESPPPACWGKKLFGRSISISTAM